MNTMAKAHMMVKALIAKLSESARYKGQYAAMFRIALKQAHKDVKRILSGVVDTVRANTLELKEGDIVQHYNCIFRLINRTSYENDTVVRFDTECVKFDPEGPIPHHWAHREGGFAIQGNTYAYWSKVVF